jgi:response regulator RpfG family c-di-GMP phosphodiesterase
MDTICSSATLFNLVTALSEALDMVSPLVMDHHKRTAWFAVNISEELGLRRKEINEIVFAALLHDIGAFSLQERLETLQFEFENPHHHACLGYSMLKDCERLQAEARIILAHHTWWQPESVEDVGGEDVPVGSHVIHLADRTAILLGEETGYIAGVDDLLAAVRSRKGTVFMPEAVECLLELSGREDFWSGAFEPDLEDHLYSKVEFRFLDNEPIELEPIARVFAGII